MARGLRLVVYDVTQQKRTPRALGLSWHYGTHLYRGLGRIDAAYGARCFSDAFHWLSCHEGARPIDEIQFWGHGKWGRIFIEGEMLDRGVLSPTHPQHRAFQALRDRLSPSALLWFRTCETLGARAGQDFASALGDATGARIAGHTFIIGFWQSGLHCLGPGQSPAWSSAEGLARGTPEKPEAALPSSFGAPNTITCLTGQVPESF